MSSTGEARGPAQPRGCLATLAVLAAMLGIVGGGFAAADAVADLPSPPITVLPGVVVTPLSDWEFGGRSGDDSTILLSKGGGSLAVTVLPAEGDPRAALVALLEEWVAAPDGSASVGAIAPIDIRPGQPAFRATYTGTFEGVAYPLEGEVTAVRGTAGVTIFDGWAGVGDYRYVRPEVDRMISEATIR